MDASTSEKHALFPLTVFDRLFERTAFVTGWLVEGSVDSAALGSALRRVTEKWRMLSGRLHSVRVENETKWCLKIPLDTISPDYETYALTTSVAELPLSHYVPLPLPLHSASLPPSLFLHSSTPREYATWESTSHPLTCWHLTYFPANLSSEGKVYTCIGFARGHGMFDGIGAAAIVRALVAELNGRDWDVPPLPSPGLNVNPIQEALDPLFTSRIASGDENAPFGGFTVLGIFGALRLLMWHLRERWWRGANRQIVILPKGILSSLVEGVRRDLQQQPQHSESVTTGDILVAWILKTIYSSGTSCDTIVHCSNLGSFRSHLSTEDQAVVKYPHNAFVPLPYRPLSVKDLNSLSISALSQLLAMSRASFSISHVISAYKSLKTSVTAFPVHPDAHETLLISNVSASRILESDWSSIGGAQTLCGYRYQATPTGLLMTNAVYIAGRLTDGSVILDATLSALRLGLITADIQKRVATASLIV